MLPPAAAAADMQSAIEDALNRHNAMLAQHQAALEQLTQQRHVPLDDTDVVWTAIRQTQSMLEDFSRCRDAYNEAQTRAQTRPQRTPPQPYANPSKTRQPAPTTNTPEHKVDPSGLFMSDTTPTPIDELLNQSKHRSNPAKRRALGEVFSEDAETNNHKKMRLKEREVVVGHSSVRGKVHDMAPKPSASGATDGDDEDDSFIRDVQKLHEEKERKRLKKEQKKRKRDSGASDGQQERGQPSVSVQMQDMSISNDAQRSRKRQKTSNHNESRSRSSSQHNARPHSQDKLPKKRQKAQPGARNDRKTKKRRI